MTTKEFLKRHSKNVDKYHMLWKILVLLLFCGCGVKITQKSLLGSMIDAAGPRVSFLLASNSYPAKLNVLGTRVGDSVYVLKNASASCDGGSVVGFDFRDSDSPIENWSIMTQETSFSLNLLVTNGSERICTKVVNVSVASSTGLSLTNRTQLVSDFIQTSQTVAPWSPMSGTRVMNNLTFDVNTNQLQGTPNYQKISGDYGTCVLNQEQGMTCWGDYWINDTLKMPKRLSAFTDLVEVAYAIGFFCGLRSNGTIVCAGYNHSGQLGNGTTASSWTPGQVTGLSDVVQIRVGTSKACALVRSGLVYCWGRNSPGLGNGSNQSNLPVLVTNLNQVISLSVSNSMDGSICAVTSNGSVSCWGWINGTPTPSIVSGVASAVQVSASDNHACALRSDRRVLCWGRNFNGQLGNNTFTDSASAVLVSGISNANKVIVGSNISCAILEDGKVKCWGRNSNGQLGDETIIDRPAPVEIAQLDEVIDMSIGNFHSCALKSDGSSYCWGRPDDFYLGNGVNINGGATRLPMRTAVNTFSFSGEPRPALSSKLSLGANHSCLVDDQKKVRCWGRNQYGQASSSTDTVFFSPRVATTGDFVSVSSSPEHTCGLLESGELKCWGRNLHGVTSDVSLSNIAQVSAGGEFSSFPFNCTLDNSGEISCWGYNFYGQLGRGNTTSSSVPQTISSALTFNKVSTGSGHACGLTDAGEILCWGRNDSGQLGNGSNTHSTTPFQIQDFNGVKDIDAGGSHTCALMADDTVRCWGNNTHGQIGNTGNGNFVPSPAYVVNLSSITKVSAGTNHTCALRNNGQVYCWGQNNRGQVGQVASNFVENPTIVGGISNAVDIGTGDAHTCALLATGVVECWGDNKYGQSGNPIPITGALTTIPETNIKDFATGEFHFCYINSQDEVKCSGTYNYLGRTFATVPSVDIDLEDATEIESTQRFKALSSGAFVTCGVSFENDAYCWGNAGYGEAGPWSTDAVRKIDLGSRKVLKISSGTHFFCALTDDNKIYCWGINDHSQLGFDGFWYDQYSPPYSDTPVEVTIAGTIKEVSAGGSKVCAIVDDSVYCWGEGYASTPQLISSSSGVHSIQVYQKHVCGIFDAEKRLKCWGENTASQFGIASFSVAASTTPVDSGIQSVEKLFESSLPQTSFCGGFCFFISTYEDAESNKTCFRKQNESLCMGNVIGVTPKRIFSGDYVKVVDKFGLIYGLNANGILQINPLINLPVDSTRRYQSHVPSPVN